MIVYCVHVFVKPGCEDRFIEATRRNRLGTLSEKGNVRFDVLRSEKENSRFLLYEVYESAEAVAAHKATSHYAEWRDAVAEWMEKPREGVPYLPVFADEGAPW